MKNYIIILKEKLSTIKNYAAEIQSILIEMIDILDFIIEYLRENDRTIDAEMIKIIEDE